MTGTRTDEISQLHVILCVILLKIKLDSIACCLIVKNIRIRLFAIQYGNEMIKGHQLLKKKKRVHMQKTGSPQE